MYEELPPKFQEKSFGSLHTLAGFFQFIGALIIFGSVATALYILLDRWAFAFALLPAVSSLITGVFVFAIGESIKLFLSMEQNTRLTVVSLHQTTRQSPKSAPDIASYQEEMQAMNQQIETLSSEVKALRQLVHTMAEQSSMSAETLKTIAENTRATATLLYNQQQRMKK